MARKKKVEVSQAEADKMVENGEAEIPAEAVVESEMGKVSRTRIGVPESSSEKSDIEMHPKFAKFK